MPTLFISWPFWDYSLSAALFGDTNKILLQPWSGERTQQSMQEAECSFISSVARKENYQVQRLSQADWHTAAPLQKHADIPHAQNSG